MKPLLLTISTVILSTSFLCSQKAKDVFVPDNLPGKGPVNLVPLGGKGPSGAAQNMRTQIRIPASFLRVPRSATLALPQRARGTTSTSP